jgi:hypothetical protein
VALSAPIAVAALRSGDLFDPLAYPLPFGTAPTIVIKRWGDPNQPASERHAKLEAILINSLSRRVFVISRIATYPFEISSPLFCKPPREDLPLLNSEAQKNAR